MVYDLRVVFTFVGFCAFSGVCLLVWIVLVVDLIALFAYFEFGCFSVDLVY